MSNAAITIENLTKTYGNLKAVDNLSLTVREGDFIAFLGPKNATKSPSPTVKERPSTAFKFP